MLRIANLDFAYPNGESVLDDVSLTVGAGETALIIGDNGSGKTTIGKLIAGLLQPTRGQLTIDKIDIATLEPRKRCRYCSYMGQVSHLSVLSSSLFKEIRTYCNGRSHEVSEAAYLEWARGQDLPTDLETNPRDIPTPDLWRLVAGLYSRVLQPKVLVIDEVFCAGANAQINCAMKVLAVGAEEHRATVVLYQRPLPIKFDYVYQLKQRKLCRI